MTPPPLFVLCCSRSGSTLLRYILDTHPDIFCPPELHLCQLANQLDRTFKTLTRFPPKTSKADKSSVTNPRVRETIDTMMASYTQIEGKKLWCEKSVYTLTQMPLIHSLYPDAKFICQHRHCLDQVSSAMETLERDPSGNTYGYTQFLQNANFDAVNGLVDYWLWMTNTNLNYEKFNPSQCHRISYEAIVNESENTLKKLFAFLDVSWEPALLDDIFKQDRKIGSGDHKIIETNKIESNSVGKNVIDPQKITADRLKKINELHSVLGYATL